MQESAGDDSSSLTRDGQRRRRGQEGGVDKAGDSLAIGVGDYCPFSRAEINTLVEAVIYSL